jgi:hypothetical protein
MACCRYCTEETGRKLGCHSTCEKYLAEVAENKRVAEERHKDDEYYAYMADKKHCK